jgi:hypothetical protein
MSEDDNLSDKDDRLIQRYDTILKESALLTTFSGILFGFLLNISVNTPRNFSLIDIIVTIIALYSITIAASLFVMPVIYHHVQYPYVNWNKFKVRSHRFYSFWLNSCRCHSIFGFRTCNTLSLRISRIVYSCLSSIYSSLFVIQS